MRIWRNLCDFSLLGKPQTSSKVQRLSSTYARAEHEDENFLWDLTSDKPGMLYEPVMNEVLISLLCLVCFICIILLLDLLNVTRAAFDPHGPIQQLALQTESTGSSHYVDSVA
ncbi:unnamed protein product [Cuscuta europaea]|uniref:Uncharacterized protein n=1 Tax=Cuscuta europaea TaxID=41803 RepID=A0A9P0YN62_CUSEU|nr:unnamed protein product [Cuscuta europaea]